MSTTTAPQSPQNQAPQNQAPPDGQPPANIPATPAEPSTAPSAGQGGLIAALIVALVLAVILALAAAFFVLRYRRKLADRSYTPHSAYVPPAMTYGPGGQSAAAPSSTANPGADMQRLQAERDALATMCIQLADVVRDNPAQFAQIQQGLARAGYQLVDPTGLRFDSQRHEGLQTRPTTDPALDMIIAATARFGYHRNDRIVRLPEVVVYRYQPTDGPRW
jgi:hypothetical protein